MNRTFWGDVLQGMSLLYWWRKWKYFKEKNHGG